MKIDVDRLHAVINGEVKQKGCGHTIAKLEQLIGFIEVKAVRVIFCKCMTHQECLRLNSIIINKVNCLNSLGQWPVSEITYLGIVHGSVIEFSNGVTLKLVTDENMLRLLTGVSDYLLLDFTKDFTNEDSSYC